MPAQHHRSFTSVSTPQQVIDRINELARAAAQARPRPNSRWSTNSPSRCAVEPSAPSTPQIAPMPTDRRTTRSSRCEPPSSRASPAIVRSIRTARAAARRTPAARRARADEPTPASAALHLADGCRWPFLARPDEFTRLIGAHTAAGFGRPWREIAETFGLDPEGRVVKAIATRDTWSGITLNWPVDGGGRLPVELSGLPVYDRTRGILPAIAASASAAISTAWRGLPRCAASNCRAPTRTEGCRPASFRRIPAGFAAEMSPPVAARCRVASAATPQSPASTPSETSPQTDLETSVEPPKELHHRTSFRFAPLANRDRRP